MVFNQSTTQALQVIQCPISMNRYEKTRSIFMSGSARGERTCAWLTGRGPRNDSQAFWNCKNSRDIEAFKCESIRFHRFYWSIDNLAELFNEHEYRHSAGARGSTSKNRWQQAPEYNRRQSSWEWLRAGSSRSWKGRKKPTFGDENVMSPVPNDIFASRVAFCDNYSA